MVYIPAEVTLSYNTLSTQSIHPDLQKFISGQYGPRLVTARRIAVSNYHIDIDAWPMDDQHPYAESPGYIVVPDQEIALGNQLHLSLLVDNEGEFAGRLKFGIREHPLVAALNNRVKQEPLSMRELDPHIVKVVAGMLPPELSKPPVWENWYSPKRWRRGTDPMAYINRHIVYPNREVTITI